MQNKIRIVYIESKYISYLQKFDSKVMYNKGQTRPYIGILFEVNGLKYFAPLSHPKEKFKNMRNSETFMKIKNGEYGAINFNNMIPARENCTHILNTSNILDKKYKLIVLNQLAFFDKNYKQIIAKAEKLYRLSSENKLRQSVKQICCDFRLLESKAQLYKNN